MVVLGDGFKFEVSSAKQEGPGAPRLRIADFGLRIERRRPGAGTGGQMCKTNPIWPGWTPLTEETVQNKPNFVPSQAANGGNRAKRTQFLDCGLEDVGRERPTYQEAKCAKRTQFGELSKRMVSTAHLTTEGSVQNKANLGRDDGEPSALWERV